MATYFLNNDFVIFYTCTTFSWKTQYSLMLKLLIVVLVVNYFLSMEFEMDHSGEC